MSDQNNYENETKYEVKHVYDDIHELNHPAPFWWQLIFYLSIVWGIGYYAYYQVLGGQTLKESLNQELVRIEGEQLKLKGAGPNEDELLAISKDSSQLPKGKEVFLSKCASCHGNDGQGVIGPNLTDRYWINGNGSARAIYDVVDKGVAEKGMPPWGPLMTIPELKLVSSYVKSLNGSNPSNPKAPQGTEIK